MPVYRKIIKPSQKAASVVAGRRGRDRQLANIIDSGRLNYNSLNELFYKGRLDRIERYRVYDAMDEDTDVCRALDMIAEHCTTKDKITKNPIRVEVDPDEVTEEDLDAIHTMLDSWVALNDWDNRAYRTIRNTIKFGDCFFIRDPKDYSLRMVSARCVAGTYVDRNTGEILAYHLTGLNFKIDEIMNTNIPQLGDSNKIMAHAISGAPPQEPRWDAIVEAENIIHVTASEGHNAGGNGQNDDLWPFGCSFLEQVYITYKQRSMLEDAALIHRVQRAPSRRVWTIHVGKMNPAKAHSYIKQLKNELMQKRVPSKFGGQDKMDSVYNPIAQMDDFFVPKYADGSGPTVENLEGQQWDNMNDMKYFTSKILRGFRIPVSFMLGPEEGGATYNDGRIGTAYMQEYQFSLFCERIQDIIDNVLDREFKTFMRWRGVQIHSSLFKLKFVPPMNFDEYREGALIDERLNHFSSLSAVPFIAKRTLLEKYLKWTAEEITENELKWQEENNPAEGRQYAQDNSMGGMGVGGGSLGGFSGMGPTPGGGMPGAEAGETGLGQTPGVGGAAGTTGAEGGAGAAGLGGGTPGAGMGAGTESKKMKLIKPLLIEDDENKEEPLKREPDTDEEENIDHLLDNMLKDNRPHLTLAKIQQLRLERENRRAEMVTRLNMVAKMYQSPPSAGM